MVAVTQKSIIAINWDMWRKNQDSGFYSWADTLFPACEIFFSSVKSSQQAAETAC